ncbi:hypothetical protein [Peristeroidobacter agariperforans]|uniref:hypothetical protein n=1 Tax=Peristeroidobacter agariperforans TaxID=268404 RepID=UPI00101BB210|nr:hypothetical protein [Peristeroidobacter agariperforans]
MFQDFRPAAAGVILFVCGLLSITSSAAGENGDFTSAVGEQAIARSMKAALQGNARLAAAALQSAARSSFAGKDVVYRRCMLQRFGPDATPPPRPEVGDPFLSDVLGLYQTYWWHALMFPATRDRHSGELQRGLSNLLGEPDVITDWDALDERVARELRARGYYSQLGNTPPLRELMVWRKQDSSVREVRLPERSYPVQLEVLNDFVTRGWSSFARCERSSNGGWATDERLYAVGPAFPQGLDSEAFRASLLGHETQHFADLQQFPSLAAWELEYRAKLTELWTSRDSLRFLLGKFNRDQGDDEQVPHLFANKRVLRDLQAYLSANGSAPAQEDLSDVPADELRAAAAEVLTRDTRTREHAASMAGTSPAMPGK